MVKTLLLTVALLLSLPLHALTKLSASVDKNPALRGEAVTLEITADAKVATDALNFRVLEQHFTVMLPSISTSTQIINGQASQSTRWRVVLLPKASGDFTIPAFTLQGLTTEPINVQILDGSVAKNANNNQQLFLEAELEPQQLYVQQLGYYQVTIYFNGDLQRGSLSEPQLDDASISQVGQDVEGSKLVNGIRYRTITRRYAVTPQRSGNYTILPPTFSGEMLDRDSARYNYFAATKTVLQQAQPIDVKVNAIPDSFPGDWLVAGLVTLTEEWNPNIDELKQGEPVTRIITLSAVDVAENQLPELKQGFPDGLRLYQEQPQAKSAERSGRLVAQKIFTTAIIANKAGVLELPEVALPWWNSQTNKLDYAKLPARTLTVAASAVSSSNNADVADSQLTQTDSQSVIPVSQPNYGVEASSWQWNYLTTLMLALWLLSLFIIYVWLQLKTPAKQQLNLHSRVAFNSNVLKRACEQGDPQLARDELLRFAHQQLDTRCLSISELSNIITAAELKQQLTSLNSALYGNSNEKWQGAQLWQAWQQYHTTKTATAPKNSLPPLYPT